jgi:hypothetical protein
VKEDAFPECLEILSAAVVAHSSWARISPLECLYIPQM